MDIRWAAVMLLVMYLIVEIKGNDTPPKATKRQRIWSKWFRCTVSCGKGWQSRVCLGSRAACNFRMADRRRCNEQPCPVPEDGGWSKWEPYSQCEKVSTNDECMGIQESTRTCNSPAPQPGGKYCAGCDSRVKPCSLC